MIWLATVLKKLSSNDLLMLANGEVSEGKR